MRLVVQTTSDYLVLILIVINGIGFLEGVGHVTFHRGREGDYGKVVRLRTMRSGTVVGELGSYLDRKASASVTADEPCTLFYLQAAKLKGMEEDAHEIASAFHRFLAGILKRAFDRDQRYARSTNPFALGSSSNPH